MSKKKACLNPICSDCRQTKYKASEQVCPHCHNKLEFVCAKKGCYKPLLDNQKDKYCMGHRAEIDDNMAGIWDNAKKVGVLALSIGVSTVLGKIGNKKK